MANLIEEITKIRQILEGEGGGAGSSDFTTATVKIYNHTSSYKTVAIPHIVDSPDGFSAVAYLDAAVGADPTPVEFVVPIYKNGTTYIELLNGDLNARFDVITGDASTDEQHVNTIDVAGDCELGILTVLN